MMEQQAVVIRLEGDEAYVELDAAAGCGRCQAGGGCRSDLLGELFCPTPRQYRLANGIGARPGETVVIRLAEGTMLRAAFLVYFLPLLLLLLGATAGAFFGGGSDAVTALGAAAGFGIAVPAALTLRRRWADRLAGPVLVRRLPSPRCKDVAS